LRWRVLPAVLISLAAGLAGLGSASQVALAASQGVSLVSAGDCHSCAIESGRAYCWGDNSFPSPSWLTAAFTPARWMPPVPPIAGATTAY
jgi:Regulator of chromosome condensation (RCC1) repeat